MLHNGRVLLLIQTGMRPTPQVLVGHPDYEVTGGTAIYKGKNLFEFEAEERAHMGLFLR